MSNVIIPNDIMLNIAISNVLGMHLANRKGGEHFSNVIQGQRVEVTSIPYNYELYYQRQLTGRPVSFLLDSTLKFSLFE